jgi:Subtilisin inhibitor-like
MTTTKGTAEDTRTERSGGGGLRPASTQSLYPHGMRALVFTAALLTVLLAPAASVAGPPDRTRLSITVWPDGRGAGKTALEFSLRCRPAAGNHPAPARACRRLFSRMGALRPIPAGRVCTNRAGGPQQALVQGTVNGRRVWARFNRSNACQIERWNRLSTLFPTEAPPTGLEITVWPGGRGGRSFRTTLSCDPAGGSHPDAEKACARLVSLEDPFGPLPYEMPCILVSSGPQVAAVEGRFRGQAVDARFDRSDSCETRRWERIAIVFAEP